MEIIAVTACVVWCCMAIRLFAGENLLLAAVTEDDDMKIVSPGSFSPSRKEESSEQAAIQFLLQRESGNIEKARELGRRFAQVLLDNPPPLFLPTDNPDLHHHRLLLYSYAVNRVIAEGSPNSIVAQTSLNVFYNVLETARPALYKHVSDTAAFSLYILCERSNKHSRDEIGKVYAQLNGCEGDTDKIQEGNTLYRMYRDRCEKMQQEIGYALSN